METFRTPDEIPSDPYERLNSHMPITIQRAKLSDEKKQMLYDIYLKENASRSMSLPEKIEKARNTPFGGRHKRKSRKTRKYGKSRKTRKHRGRKHAKR
jgi:hypothetical protein